MNTLAPDSLVSIIVPFYNCEKYIEKCVESILSQTYINLEIILIDNNSQDNSRKIVDTYKEKDNRVRVVECNDPGVSFARNKGIKVANGEYIIFVDSDDWIDNKFVEKLMLYRDYDVVICSYYREYENSTLYKHIYDGNVIFDDETSLQQYKRRFFGLYGKELKYVESADSLSPVWGKLYKKSIISENRISFYDISKIGTYEDGIFNINYNNHINSVFFLNEGLYHYRKNNVNSITSNYDEGFIEKRKHLYNVLGGLIESKHLSSDYSKALNNRIVLELIGIGLNSIDSQNSFLVVKNCILDSKYRECIKNFCLKDLPFKWKIFFFNAKTGNYIIVYLLLKIIRNLKGK